MLVIPGTPVRWESSRDGGITWKKIDCTSTMYIELDPKRGEVMYRILNEDGAYSEILTITYYDVVPEEIVTTPAIVAKTVDESTIFTLDVEDDGYTYQWMHDGVAIIGATESNYTIPVVKSTDAGSYYCVVSNPVSTVNSSTVNLTVNKCAQVIDFPEMEAKEYGDADFLLPAVTDKGLPISYQSSNKNVATVSGNVVSIKGVGEAIIIANQVGNDDYLEAAYVTRKLTVNKITQTITFSKPAEKTYEDRPFTLPATTDKGLTISYMSSNVNVATISGNVVTIVGAGNTEIVASQSGDSYHYAATPVTHTLTVNRKAQTITFDALRTVTYGDAPIVLNEYTDKNLPITYTSSNTEVAVVTNNKVNIQKPGVSIITATQSGTNNYLSAQAVSHTLTVNKAPQTIEWYNMEAKNYGDADFTLPAMTDKGLTISYVSDNKSVAVVNGNVVSIRGVGKTNLTATQAGNEYYEAAVPVTRSLVVLKSYETSSVYLKNVGSGKFLTAANWWGTCASLGEHGLDMTLALLPNGKYTIDTQIKGSESNYFLGKIGEKLYMDATSTEWMIEDQGNGRYTLSLDGTYYMGFDGTSVVSENLTNSADANAQWQLLTREDLITEMKYATMASPVDATFYIRGANFSRQDLRNSAWIGEPSIGGEDENFCAEKWNSGVCTVYQELKDLPNGVYKLKTQGFYRMGGHDVAVNHRNEGTENYDVKFFANDASVPVMSVMDEAGKLSDVGVAYGNYGNAPSDMTHATQFFNKGYYQHEFYFTVTDGTAVVGIVNNSGLLDDWMCFDNFELYYCGEAAVILDSQASYSQVEDKQYASIAYTRNFKNTNWQALYVPFEIPLTEEFLDDFEIAYINDVHQFDDNNDGTIDRTEVEAIKKVSGTLEANYPYMIRAKVAGEKTITVTDAMLYATEENSIDCSSVFSTYTFTGTYKKIPAVQLPKEEGYYAMSGGDWKQYSSGATSSLGAFRIYMKIDSRNENMKAQAHTIKMRVVGCDDEADDVTGIDDSQLTMDNSPLVIYDMQGRRITDMANLKGVYIVNGKKVVY
ncbi:MAG: hypothetical protein J6S11_06450 [Bacteroidaceae bacterium]|nr:hypothetical protein [Bacteroidaceae bacterium]